jgi:hypothetical protein
MSAYLIEEGGVVNASGSRFMQVGYLRLSFATPEETIRAGMRAAREAMGRLTWESRCRAVLGESRPDMRESPGAS